MFKLNICMFNYKDNDKFTKIVITIIIILNAFFYMFSNYNEIDERRRKIDKTNFNAEKLLINVIETYMCFTLIIIVRQIINTYVRKTKKINFMYKRRKLNIYQILRSI